MANSCYSPISLIISYTNADSMDAGCRILLETETMLPTIGVLTYLSIFVLTCVMELPLYWYGLRQNLKTKSVLSALLVLNLATHPAVTWLFPRIFLQADRLNRDYLLCSELFAIVFEALILFQFYKVKPVRAFGVALIANLFSWWAGLYVAAVLFAG